MQKNNCLHKATIKRFEVPDIDMNYMIEIVENENDLESWLVEKNYCFKLFCIGIPKNSENKGQIMELLKMTLNEMWQFKNEYEEIKDEIEEI